jgi:cytochrome c biogenesis protein
MKSVWRFFSSVKLAITLFILVAAASIIGTLIPQGRTAAEYATRYGGLAPLFIRLQLTVVYHSFWYLALLGLFALNTIVCTLSRLSPKLRRVFRPAVESDPKALGSLKIKDRLKRPSALAESAEAAVRALRAARYGVRTSGEGTRTHLLGRKRLAGIFGSDIVHIGLLVTLAGGIVSGVGGFKAEIPLKEGETAPVPRASFEVRLDKFTTEFYPDGAVKDWKSTVTVLEGGTSVLTKTVEVNHPLSHRGFSFYQMSYGYDWEKTTLDLWAKKKSDAAFLKKLSLSPGARAGLDDPDKTEIIVQRFIPDFVIGEGNQPETRSLQPNNPAALIEGYRGGAKVFDGWIFANFPDFAQMHGAEAADLVFELKGFRAGEYSILEAARDPGVGFIWAGCILVMLGCTLAFYWPTWEIRAFLEESQGKTEISLGGLGPKSRDRFEKEFAAVAASLRRSS